MNGTNTQHITRQVKASELITHGFSLMGNNFNDTYYQKRHVITQLLSYHYEHTIFFPHISWRQEIASNMFWFRPNFRHAFDSFPPSQYNHVNIVHKSDIDRKHIATYICYFPDAIFFECHNIYINYIKKLPWTKFQTCQEKHQKLEFIIAEILNIEWSIHLCIILIVILIFPLKL